MEDSQEIITWIDPAKESPSEDERILIFYKGDTPDSSPRSVVGTYSVLEGIDDDDPPEPRWSHGISAWDIDADKVIAWARVKGPTP